MSTLFDEFKSLLGEVDLPKDLPPFTSTDALLIIDMQADFVPHDAVANPQGGKFGVAEGGDIVKPIVKLIDAAVKAKATVCATRDYHPHDHCSFNTHGGPFPAHCVQGTPGSFFMKPIAESLAAGVRVNGSEKVFVAFKAMHEHTDSFGALPYVDGGKGRIVRCGVCEEEPNPKADPTPMGCSAAPWTGSLILKQSALSHAKTTDEWDIDAPPDVLSVLEDGVDRGLTNLQDSLKGCKRIFVCGLALDFCVLDTCLNGRGLGFDEVYMIYDAARAAHIPGIGSFGSGFLSDPKEVLSKMTKAKVGLVTTAALVGPGAEAVPLRASFAPAPSKAGEAAAEEVRPFPHGLGSLPLARANVDVQRDSKGVIRLTLSGALMALEAANISNELPCAPSTPMPKDWPDAPPHAHTMCFVSPMKGLDHLGKGSKSRLTFLAISASAELSFAAYGGFLFFARDGRIVGAQSVSDTGSTKAKLEFGPPMPWRHEFTQSLWEQKRLQPVTLPHLLQAGASHFCFLNPHESFTAGASSRVVTKTGGFLYLRESLGLEPIYFELKPPPPLHVAYVTDVEGNMEYFTAWLKRTDSIKECGLMLDGSLDLELEDGWAFVFGGDAVDKGGVVGGSIRVVRSLVRLKEKYPTRVFLILGNRDINKMRITSEMHATQLQSHMLEHIPGPFWVPPAKAVSPKAYLEKVLEKAKGEGGSGATSTSSSSSSPTSSMAALNTPFNRLKWMLIETMGAAGEEERRRRELARMAGAVDPSSISDEEVIASFRESVEEHGFMRKYLQLGQLAVVVGKALYVHGGLIGYGPNVPDCVGIIPGQSEKVKGVKEWVDALNAWKDGQLDDWSKQPQWADTVASPTLAVFGGGYDSRGGQMLMEYAVAGGPHASVVLGRHLDGGMPKEMPKDVVDMLTSAGIDRVIIGHTPHGNCPTVIKQEAVETLMADTSFSDMSAADNRGSAVSTIAVMADGTVKVKGETQDGMALQYELPPLDTPASAAALIGRMEPELSEDGQPNPKRRFVKAGLTQNGELDLLLCRVEGFKVEYSTMSSIDARRKLRLAASEPPYVGKSASSQFSQMGDPSVDGCHDEHASNQLDELLALFVEMDANGDGALSLDECVAALKGKPMLFRVLTNLPGSAVVGDAQITKLLFKELDTSKDGEVSIDEFVQAFGFKWDAAAKEKLAALKKAGSGTPRPSPPPPAGNGGAIISAVAEEWRSRAEGAEARALAAEQKLADFWKARAEAAEARLKAAEAVMAPLQQAPPPPSPSTTISPDKGPVPLHPAKTSPSVFSTVATLPPSAVADQMPGRHSSSLIMKRCIDELGKIVDDMPSGRTDGETTANRIQQSLNTLKELQRRVASI